MKPTQPRRGRRTLLITGSILILCIATMVLSISLVPDASHDAAAEPRHPPDPVSLVLSGGFDRMTLAEREQVAADWLETVRRRESDGRSDDSPQRRVATMRLMMTHMDSRARAYAKLTDTAQKNAFLDREIDEIRKHAPSTGPPPAPPVSPAVMKSLIEQEDPLASAARFAFIRAIHTRAQHRGIRLPGPGFR